MNRSRQSTDKYNSSKMVHYFSILIFADVTENRFGAAEYLWRQRLCQPFGEGSDCKDRRHAGRGG